MSKKLLPCPVCGGDSFIESVTQGGLICSDCGAVSNQVEVADDDDPQLAPKTFIRSTSYKHVTEEESQAKRDSRSLLRIPDRRDTYNLLEGLGEILDSMIQSCISKGRCHETARHCVRRAWFDFLEVVPERIARPIVLRSSTTRSLLVGMSAWGIPGSDIQAEIVMKDLPAERSKRFHGLNVLMHDRRMDTARLRMIEDSPSFIFAHDWLCHFFGLDEFPIPDWVLHKFCKQSKKISFVDVQNARKQVSLARKGRPLSPLERRSAVRKLFHRIMTDDTLRKQFQKGSESLVDDKIPLQNIDVTLLLSILTVGIRNSGTGVEPIHVLNWIARGDLAFFSAHRCLSAPTDRLEYYRVWRTNHGYTRSLFAPPSVPSARELSKTLDSLRRMGLYMQASDPISLIETVLNMLGLNRLAPLAVHVFSTVIDGLLSTSKSPFKPECKGIGITDPLDGLEAKIEDSLLSDITVNEFVLASIAVAMKMVFPALNGSAQGAAEAHPGHPVIGELLSVPMTYHIMSDRQFRGDEAKWWSALSGYEKKQFLKFVEAEKLCELRESVVEDFRQMLDSEWEEKEFIGDAVGGSELGRCILSGPVSAYRLCGEMPDTDSDFFHIVADLETACQVDSGVFKIFRIINKLEAFIFQ